jgi:ribosomal-protein-alanine N-acetyltransferase
MIKELTGDVASIRLLGPNAADEYFDVLLRNREFLQPYEPVRPAGYWTLDEQREQLEQVAREAAAGTGFAFGVYDRADGALVGRVALANIVRKAWQNATLGYWIDVQRNGRGRATEGSKLALRFAFGEAGLHRIQAGVMPHNPRSIRVVEKLGMRFEGLAERYLLINGVWEDHRMYAITLEEWQA